MGQIRISEIFITAFVIHAISPSVIAQSLNSTLAGGQFACLGSRVTFTCITRGSDGIAWTSDTYIGRGGVQLGFLADTDTQGNTHTSRSNVDTVATLTKKQVDQGVTILESTLSINPLPDPQNASVTCIRTASDERNTTTFQVIDEPATPEDVVPVPIEHYGGNCVIHTVWNSRNHYDVTQYEVFANGTLMPADIDVVDANINRTRISALFPISCAAYEITVNASNACGRTPRVSNLTPRMPLHSIADPEREPATRSTNPNEEVSSDAVSADREPVTQSCESNQGTIIGVSVALGLPYLIIIAVIVVIVVIIVCYKKKSPKGNSSGSPTDERTIQDGEQELKKSDPPMEPETTENSV